jgi:hypothetical protein
MHGAQASLHRLPGGKRGKKTVRLFHLAALAGSTHVFKDDLLVGYVRLPYSGVDLHHDVASEMMFRRRRQGVGRVMARGKPLPAATGCNAPVTQWLALGRKLNVTGTPTIIFGDNIRISGAISAERFPQMLGGNKE